MGTKYTTTSSSGYNASPPADDGSAVASNEIRWSYIKEKLSDTLKTFIESVNSKLVTHFDESVLDKGANYSITAAEHKRTINMTAAFTPSLGDAATMGVGFIVTIKNSHTAAITVGRVTSGDTIDGTAADVTLAAGAASAFIVNLGADGYLQLTKEVFDAITAGSITTTGNATIGGTLGVTGDTTVVNLAATDITLTGVLKEAKGTDVASASALSLANDGNFYDVTGTTGITSIGTVGIGTSIKLQFDGAVLLTHHATNLILPGAANYTTVAGDVFTLTEYASGQWIVTATSLVSGKSLVESGSVLGTVGSISGTSNTFTNIPSWVKKITMTLHEVSTNGTVDLEVRIGDSGGIESSGYVGESSGGFSLTTTTSSSDSWSGLVTLVLQDAATNRWCYTSTLFDTNGSVPISLAGAKALTGTLDRIMLTTATDLNEFDDGEINILYE